MALILDPATEQRIQRETARGPYSAPDEFLNLLLDVFEANDPSLVTAKSALVAKFQRGSDQIDRGETYSSEQARAILAERRATRTQR